MAELQVGSEIGGLRLDEIVGRGGMGVVYRATQLSLNRTVALKLVAPNLAEDPEFRERFKRESELAASLEHPHIVPVYNAGEENGLLYITMRFVDGIDLGMMIARQGQLEPQFACHVINQVASALDAAHARGMVHRDVKPANILIEGTGRQVHAYLTDFGLTKLLTSPSGLTKTGTVLGTMDYIAPEQLEGHGVDARADIYSLGCVLFQALSGRVPFPRSNDQAKIWAHISEQPPVLSLTSPEVLALDQVLQRSMAKQPDWRFASAGDFGRAAVAAATGPLQQRFDPGIVDPSIATCPVAPSVGSDLGYTSWYGGATSPAPRSGDLPDRFGVPPGSLPPAPPTISGPPYFGAPESPTPPPTHKPRGKLPLILSIACVVVVLAVVAGAIVFTRLLPTAAGTIVGEPISVGAEPLDVEVGEGFVWIANRSSGTISRVNPTDATSQEIRVGGNPILLEADRGAVWVWNYRDSITRVDVRTGQASRPIATGTDSPITGIAVGGGYVWLSHSANGTVTRLNMQTQAVEGGPILVGSKPTGMGFGDRFLYVVNSGDNTVSAVDGPTGKVLWTSRKINQGAWGIEVYDGVIYVGATDDVTPIDERSFVIGEPIPLKGFSGFAPGGGSLWVAYPLDNVVRRIDLQTRQPRGEPIKGIGKGIGDVAFADNVLWVSNSTQNTLIRIRPNS